MEQFSYSFALSMLHSIWQMALLLLVYACIIQTVKNPHPLFKRNLLFATLGVQSLCTVLTCMLYLGGPSESLSGTLTEFIAGALISRSQLQDYTTLLFYIYIAAVTYKFCALLYHFFLFNHNKTFIKPSAEIKVFTSLKTHHLGIKRKVTVWYSEAVASPVTFGFLKPVILLPLALVNNLSIQETEALIVHELTHIKYNDYLLNWMLMVTETIFFFNPFVRIVASKIRLEREKNCDVQVLQFEYCPVKYAEALLKTAAAQNLTHKQFQLAAVKTKTDLLQRIRFFSGEHQLVFSKSRHSILPSVVLAIFFLVNIGIADRITQNAPVQPLPAARNSISPAGSLPASNSEILPVTYTDGMVESRDRDAAYAAPIEARYVKEQQLVEEEENNIPGYNEASVTQYAIHASLVPEELAITKEIILTEENSSGKTIRTAYKISYKNGEWATEPLLMIAEIRASIDSSTRATLDTLLQILPVVQ